MRLWSIHPKYLDTSGLVALWREGLLAQKVLMGKTKGYKNHPQLMRFKNQQDPVLAIANYLFYIYQEAEKRGYNFNKDKIEPGYLDIEIEIAVTEGQLKYEMEHLLKKLLNRDPGKYKEIKNVKTPDAHHSFIIIPGGIADWERKL